MYLGAYFLFYVTNKRRFPVHQTISLNAKKSCLWVGNIHELQTPLRGTHFLGIPNNKNSPR